MYAKNILETIGNTPLVRLNKIVEGIPGTILAKVETTNPGSSIKDRMAVKIIEDAEKSGELKPGATIVEGTSGNTGMGLAIAAVVKGYKCIFVTNDKQSKEKVDALKAVGAEVIVCPTAVTPEDPRSYYSVSKRLSIEIPGAYYANQYNNLSNRTAHYEQTGPEIWEQTEGKITHLVVGVGTGGTISGTGKYLKEKNPNIKIWGIDTYGSVFKKYHETGEFDEKEIYPYITEGIGEDILPENVDFSVIDRFEKVTDKDGLVYQRRLAREEGILVGNSAGSAIKGIEQLKDELDEDSLVVVIFHDHGSNYMGKAFNDEWMIERGFLDKKAIKTALDLVENHKDLHLVTIDENEDVSVLLEKMEKFDISQIPVSNEAGELVGSITDTKLFHECIKNPDVRNNKVKEIMQASFPMVNPDTSVDEISTLFTRENSAVLVKDLAGETHIITKFDVISSLS